MYQKEMKEKSVHHGTANSQRIRVDTDHTTFSIKGRLELELRNSRSGADLLFE